MSSVPTDPGGYRSRPWLFVLLLLLYTPTPVPAAMEGSYATGRLHRVSGELIYRERAMLPAGWEVRVALVDLSTRRAPAVVERTFTTRGEQVPLPFVLTVDPARLDSQGEYGLQVAITDARGRRAWGTGSVQPVDPLQPTQHAGFIRLLPAMPATALPASYEGTGRGHLALRPDDLSGGEWVVEDIGHGGIVEGSRVTLSFGGDGRLHGSTSCNHYETTYALNDQRLSAGITVVNDHACAPALMNQERAFLQILASAHHYTVSGSGALVIEGAGGSVIVARREQ